MTIHFYSHNFFSTFKDCANDFFTVCFGIAFVVKDMCDVLAIKTVLADSIIKMVESMLMMFLKCSLCRQLISF